VLSNTQIKNVVTHVLFKEYAYLKTYMLDALEGFSHTLFEFHSNYTWNLVHKICTGYAPEAFFLFLQNTLLSLLRLTFLKNKALSYCPSNDPYKLFESYSNWPLLMARKIFLFPEILKMAKCRLLFLLIRKILWV